MVTDGVDLGLVLPVHGALRGRSFFLAVSRTHMYFPWQGAPGVGSGDTQCFLALLEPSLAPDVPSHSLGFH